MIEKLVFDGFLVNVVKKQFLNHICIVVGSFSIDRELHVGISFPPVLTTGKVYPISNVYEKRFLSWLGIKIKFDSEKKMDLLHPRRRRLTFEFATLKANYISFMTLKNFLSIP